MLNKPPLLPRYQQASQRLFLHHLKDNDLSVRVFSAARKGNISERLQWHVPRKRLQTPTNPPTSCWDIKASSQSLKCTEDTAARAPAMWLWACGGSCTLLISVHACCYVASLGAKADARISGAIYSGVPIKVVHVFLPEIASKIMKSGENMRAEWSSGWRMMQSSGVWGSNNLSELASKLPIAHLNTIRIYTLTPGTCEIIMIGQSIFMLCDSPTIKSQACAGVCRKFRPWLEAMPMSHNLA